MEETSSPSQNFILVNMNEEKILEIKKRARRFYKTAKQAKASNGKPRSLKFPEEWNEN